MTFAPIVGPIFVTIATLAASSDASPLWTIDKRQPLDEKQAGAKPSGDIENRHQAGVARDGAGDEWANANKPADKSDPSPKVTSAPKSKTPEPTSTAAAPSKTSAAASTQAHTTANVISSVAHTSSAAQTSSAASSTLNATTLPSSPSPSASNGAVKNDQSSSGLSGGAIAGIVVALLIIIGAAVAFFLCRRRNRHSGRSIGNRASNFRTQNEQSVPTTPMSLNHQNSAFPSNNYSQTNVSGGLAPPPVKNQQQALAPQKSLESPAGNPDATHIVRSTFDPTLNDEVNIAIGNKVQVLTEYDDGWCMIKNLDQHTEGMCPMHCLENLATAQQGATSPGLAEKKKRVSSIGATADFSLPNF